MTGNRVVIFLSIMAIMVLNTSLYTYASGNEKLIYELNYEGVHLASITENADPVKIVVKTFKDMRDDKSIAGRSATYTIFHAKGRYEKDDCEINLEKFVTESVMKDLRTLGFEPVLFQKEAVETVPQEQEASEQKASEQEDLGGASLEPEIDTQGKKCLCEP
ncbi:MAG: hypothetical protein AB2L14_22760 [Candidatus Xenobiia bacterium LiM19]